MNALAAPPRNGELGFWVAQLADKRPSFPRFTGQESVDVAIVGGGYTGLWTAYFAKKLEPSLSVAVFEAEQVGYGASGRNGGWLSAMPPGNRATFARAGEGWRRAGRCSRSSSPASTRSWTSSRPRASMRISTRGRARRRPHGGGAGPACHQT